MPSSRFWEFEDARLDLGTLAPRSTDCRILLIETLTGFGNDWSVIPIDLPVGSLTETRSLVVTDTFGTRTLLRPTGDPGALSRNGWSMFSLSLPTSQSDAFGVAVTNLFYLPPTLVQPLNGPVLEEVSFARDELANMAWAIERRLESPLEIGVETSRSFGDAGVGGAAADTAHDVPLYRLATRVPRIGSRSCPYSSTRMVPRFVSGVAPSSIWTKADLSSRRWHDSSMSEIPPVGC